MEVLNLNEKLNAVQVEQHPDMQRIFTLQKDEYLQSPYPEAAERIEKLLQLKQALLDHQEALITALNGDFGCRSRDDSLMGDIMPSAAAINYATKRIKKWMKPQRRQFDCVHCTLWIDGGP
jgi:coniferyl-aldehyde dehydrogenase